MCFSHDYSFDLLEKPSLRPIRLLQSIILELFQCIRYCGLSQPSFFLEFRPFWTFFFFLVWPFWTFDLFITPVVKIFRAAKVLIFWSISIMSVIFYMVCNRGARSVLHNLLYFDVNKEALVRRYLEVIGECSSVSIFCKKILQRFWIGLVDNL